MLHLRLPPLLALSLAIAACAPLPDYAFDEAGTPAPDASAPSSDANGPLDPSDARLDSPSTPDSTAAADSTAPLDSSAAADSSTSADSSTAPDSSSSDASGGGGDHDAFADATAPQDASSDAAPPPPPPSSCEAGVIPPGADACCLGIPCVGMKCTQRCSECKMCSAVCCVPNGNGNKVTCAGSVNGC